MIRQELLDLDEVTIQSVQEFKTAINNYLQHTEIPTLPGFYAYVGKDWLSMIEVINTSLEHKRLWTKLAKIIETSIIERGFAEDKSFPKYYLDRYHTFEDVKATSHDRDTAPVINITLDTTPSPHYKD